MPASRPSSEQYFLEMARLVSTRSTCPRRQVGCVLVDRDNHVLATGYNGVPRGIQHCTDAPCKGALYPSGEGYELCEAIHAEQNALLQCLDTSRIHTVYCTTQPCFTCTKLIMNTPAARVVFAEPHADPKGRQLWLRKNERVNWILHSGEQR